MEPIKEALTFDDVLLLPQYSSIVPANTNLNVSLSKNINLNLGTGRGTSVLELINTFEKVNNVKIPYEFVSRRKGDLGYSVADSSFA